MYCYAEKVPYLNFSAFKDADVEYATLHVPAASLEAYKSAAQWSSFGKIVALTNEETGIKNIAADSSNSLFFTLDGKQTDMLQKGINIIKNSDGTSKKIFVK